MRCRPLAALLAVALLAAFVLVLGPERMVRDLSRADPRLVALACCSTLGSLVCWSEAQRRLHGAAGATTGPGAFGVAYATGVFLKLTLPGGRAGGPAVMAYALGRETGLEFERDLTAVLAGKFVGFLGCVPPALAGLLFVTLPFPVGRALLPTTAGLTVGGGVAAVVLVRRPGTIRAAIHRLAGLGRATVGRLSERVAIRLSHARVDAACDRAGHTLAAIRGDRRALLLTALGWGLAAGPLYFAFAALGVPVPLAFALTGVLVAVTGLPVATVGAAVLLYRATDDGVSAGGVWPSDRVAAGRSKRSSGRWEAAGKWDRAACGGACGEA